MGDFHFILKTYADFGSRSLKSLLMTFAVGLVTGLTVAGLGADAVGAVVAVAGAVLVFALLFQVVIHTQNNLLAIRKHTERLVVCERRCSELESKLSEAIERSEYNYKALELALLSEVASSELASERGKPPAIERVNESLTQ